MLANMELAIVERLERQLTRRDKKKLQWSRALTNKALHNLESQRAWLYHYLHQCNDLVASYERMSGAPDRPWLGRLPPTPLHPLSHSLPPITSSPTGTCTDRETPQYWDLSMLRDRRASPYACSADSGFHEPSVCTQSYGPDEFNGLACGCYDSPMRDLCDHCRYSTVALTRMNSKRSDHDGARELPIPLSHTKTGAESTGPAKRSYSESAIQSTEARLRVPKTHCRGDRAGRLSTLDLTVSDGSQSNVKIPMRGDRSTVSL